MKTITTALALILLAGSASAYQTTRCTNSFGTVRCTTIGDGTMTTTRCTESFGVVRCTTW